MLQKILMTYDDKIKLGMIILNALIFYCLHMKSYHSVKNKSAHKQLQCISTNCNKYL